MELFLLQILSDPIILSQKRQTMSSITTEEYPSLHYYQCSPDHKSEAETEEDEQNYCGEEKDDGHGLDLYIEGEQGEEPKGERSKVKSSLCRNFMQNGYCPYGIKCQFAHGPHQLRCNTHINTSYKTKPCHAFLKRGVCIYGFRCNFLHKKYSSSAVIQERNKQILQNFKQIIQQGRGSKLMRILQ